MKNFNWKKMTSKGAALVEYGILVGLIAVLAIVAVLNLGGTVRDTFTQVSDTLSTNINGTAEAEVAVLSTMTFVAGSNSVRRGFALSGYGPQAHGTRVSFSEYEPYVFDYYDIATPWIDSTWEGDLTGLVGHTLTCDNGLSMSFDDTYYLNYNSSTNRTNIAWNPYTGPGGAFVDGETYSCQIQ